MKIISEQDLINLGKDFAMQIIEHDFANPYRVIELIGDVGAGKTTFTRGLATGLGAVDSVTSPSFTISKSYALPSGRTLTHYDFYRLPDPGLMAEDLFENLNDPNHITVIEWGDSVTDLLPKNHTIINIKYNEDGSREVTL